MLEEANLTYIRDEIKLPYTPGRDSLGTHTLRIYTYYFNEMNVINIYVVFKISSKSSSLWKLHTQRCSQLIWINGQLYHIFSLEGSFEEDLSFYLDAK
jgi:hypothetical protein